MVPPCCSGTPHGRHGDGLMGGGLLWGGDGAAAWPSLLCCFAGGQPCPHPTRTKSTKNVSGLMLLSRQQFFRSSTSNDQERSTVEWMEKAARETKAVKMN